MSCKLTTVSFSLPYLPILPTLNLKYNFFTYNMIIVKLILQYITLDCFEMFLEVLHFLNQAARKEEVRVHRDIKHTYIQHET